MPKSSEKSTALLIKDAQKRTKAVPEKLQGDLAYIAGWCYWYKGSAIFKEFAYRCLELLTKTQLTAILAAFDLKPSKGMPKDEMVAVLKRLKITELRKHLLANVLPEFDLCVVAFEQLFQISTANRRRLQEMKDVLPIARWDDGKYGSYPVMSLEGTLKILYADKELLQQFTDYVTEKLTAEAKAKAREKELELSFKTKFTEYIEQHSHLFSDNLSKNKELNALIKAEKYKSALQSARWTVEQHRLFQIHLTNYNKLLEENPELQDLVAKEKWSFTDPSQDYLLNCAISKMNSQLKKQNKQATKLQPKLPTSPAAKTNNPAPYVQINIRPLATAFNELIQREDIEIFKIVNHQHLTYSDTILTHKDALRFCQAVLNRLGYPDTQKNWRDKNAEMLLNSFEDAIYSCDELLEIQGVEKDNLEDLLEPLKA